MATICVVVLSLVTIGVSGCAPLKKQWRLTGNSDDFLASITNQDKADNDSDEMAVSSTSQVSRTSSKSLIVEVEFVTIDSNKASDSNLDSLWQWVDETSVDIAERRMLLANGLRVGRVHDADQFRDQLTKLEHDEGVLEEFMQMASVGSDLKRPTTEHSMRLGRRYELPVGNPISGDLTTLVKLDDQIVGRTLQNPQFQFTVEPSGLMGTQEIEMKFRPEIQHGEMRNQLIGADSALRINRRRDVWVLRGLAWQTAMREGDLVVVSADHRGRAFDKKMDLIGSGLADRMMYGEHAELGNEQLFVLIRLKRLPEP